MRGRAAGFVLALALLAAGCGVDESDVRDLEDLAGVESARSSCTLGACDLSVETVASIDADDLAAVLDAARAIDASTTSIDVGTSTIDLSDSYGGGSDEAAAEAVVALRTSGIERLRVSLVDGRTPVDATAPGSRDELWDTARTVWDDLDGLPGRELVVTSAGDDGPNRLEVTQDFPTASIDLVRALSPDLPLSGVRIVDDRVLLGVPDLDRAETVERAVAAVPSTGIDVEVVLATNILSYREEGAADETQVRALTKALEAVPGARVEVDGSTVRVSADPEDAAAVAAAIPSTRTTPVTVRLGTVGEVELGTSGDPTLVTLAALVSAVPGATEVGVDTPRENLERKPPADTAASLSVDLDSVDLSAAVSAVAAVVATWESTVPSLSVYVTATDPEGREPSTAIRVDRRSGVWVPSSLGRGTKAQTDLGIRAWR